MVKEIDRHEGHYHVRLRDDDEFDQLETPDWASELADEELPGSIVQMENEVDEWLIQNVRILAHRADT